MADTETTKQKLVRENVFKQTVQAVLKIIKNRKIPTSQLKETDTLKVLTSDERNKIGKINIGGNGTKYLNNSGTYKTLQTSDILETDDKKIMTQEERGKVSKLITSGDGTKALTDDGTYKTPSSVGVVNDNVTSNDMSYSSQKIEDMFSELDTSVDGRLLGKSNLDHTHEELSKAHSHSNKDVIDQIDSTLYGKIVRLLSIIDPDKSGLGTKVFYDDLTFKEISSSDGGTGDGSSVIINSPIDVVNKRDFIINEEIDTDTNELVKVLSLLYHIVPLTNAEYQKLKNSSSLDPNTIYITTDDTPSNSE